MLYYPLSFLFLLLFLPKETKVQLTGSTVNTAGLKGNEMKATCFVAMIAPLYANRVLTRGNTTPLRGDQTVLLHQLWGQPQASPSERAAQMRLCFLWAQILPSASPHSFLQSTWEQFSKKANHSSGGMWARAVQWVGTCNLPPSNRVWLGYSSSLKKDASSFL